MTDARRVLPDTSVWVDLLCGNQSDEARLLRELIASEVPILLGDLVLYELLQGHPNEGAAERASDFLAAFHVVTLTGGHAVMAAARCNRILRRQGVTVRTTVDVLIASWCLDNDAALLHRDRDFRPFEDAFGLRVP